MHKQSYNTRFRLLNNLNKKKKKKKKKNPPWLIYSKIYKKQQQKFEIKYWHQFATFLFFMFQTGILLTFYCIKISSKSIFKISYMGKVITLPPMRVNAIFLRIRIYVTRRLWLGVQFISNWTFELSEQVITTKILLKCCSLVVIGQGPTIIYRLNDVSVNRMSMFICAKFNELKLYVYTAKHTKCYTGFSNSGSDLTINGTDVDREHQR